MTIQLHTDQGFHVATVDVRRPRVFPAILVAGKVLLVVGVLRVAFDPTWAHLDGKAPLARAIMYPLWLVAVPVLWAVFRRASTFPWLADALLTLACAADLTGNRFDLYNSIAWFDDAIHVLNAALVSAGVVLLTLPISSSFSEIAHAAVSIGLTASLAWELFEYGTFLTRSTEWTSAYSDTVGDITLGWLGSVVAALLLGTVWRKRDLGLKDVSAHPQLRAPRPG